MRTYIQHRAVAIDVNFTIRVHVELEPGVWVVREDDCDYAVTSFEGSVDAFGAFHVGYPKGVCRRPSGAWGARERLLFAAMPDLSPPSAWAAIPPVVADVLRDAYLLAREETPAQIGAQP